jgi:hypothetical protein
MKAVISAKRRIPVLVGMLTILALSGVWSVMAQDGVLPLPGGSRIFTEVQQLEPSDIADNDQFGYSVALDGDLLVEGSYAPNLTTGAIYIYERTAGTWTEADRLTGSDTLLEDYFGVDVAIDDGWVVAGAPFHTTTNSNDGAAYVFTRDGSGFWNITQELNVPGLAANSFLGGNVAIYGDRIVVGSETSKAYIFKRNTSNEWQLETDLTVDGDFVTDVDILGDRVILGSYTEETNTGAAFIYKFNGGAWNRVKKLTADDGQENDYFGREVKVYSDQAFVHASLDNATDFSSGAVYVFTEINGVWSQTQKLVSSDIAEGDRFGNDFAVDGSNLAIGAFGDGGFAGSVYLFKWNGSAWVQIDKIPSVGGQFGQSVDVQSNLLVAGAPQTNGYTGRVYVYENPELIPTNTPDPSIELLTDGGFENSVLGWEAKDSTGDKVKCNKSGKIIAYAGNCAWQFKGGAGENSKIQQVITTNATPGDTLTLSGYVNAKGAVDSKIKIVVAYLNPAIPKDKITVNVAVETAGVYTSLSSYQPSLTAEVVAPFDKIKMQVKNNSTSGKIYYDALSLTAS